MTDSIPDLWPEEFGDAGLTTPHSILQAQASALSKKTKGLVEGEMKSSQGSGGDFVHQLYLIAPVLDYRFHLLTVTHAIDLYPVNIQDLANNTAHKVGNQSDYVDILSQVFATEKTLELTP